MIFFNNVKTSVTKYCTHYILKSSLDINYEINCWFLETESDGLDPEVSVKMNSRGLPNRYFLLFTKTFWWLRVHFCPENRWMFRNFPTSGSCCCPNPPHLLAHLWSQICYGKETLVFKTALILFVWDVIGRPCHLLNSDSSSSFYIFKCVCFTSHISSRRFASYLLWFKNITALHNTLWTYFMQKTFH